VQRKWLCINGFALTKIRAARAKQTRESEPQLSDSRSPVGKLGHGHCWRKFPIGLPTLKGVAELKVKLQTVQTNLHESHPNLRGERHLCDLREATFFVRVRCLSAGLRSVSAVKNDPTMHVPHVAD